jgi:tetratricopeptide (TPR) repeat protein
MCGTKARWLAGFSFIPARCPAGFLFLVFLLLGGCAVLGPQTEALRQQLPADLPARAEIPDVPFFPQDEYYCGPASLAMALNAAGVKVASSALVEQVYLPGRKGSLQIEMLAAARRNGRIAYLIEPEISALLREVAAGTPVIVLENLGIPFYAVWHYSVVIGYDLERGDIIRHTGNHERAHAPMQLFEHFWQKEGRWAMVAVQPQRVPATATEPRYAEAVVALEKTGQTRSARVAYEAMLKRWPASLAGMMGAGNTAYALGDIEAAEARFRQAAAAYPASVPALNNLAQTLLDRGKLEEARVMAERAVALGGPLLARARETLDEIDKRQASLKVR